MFLIIVTYKAPIGEIDRFLAAHRAFLDERFAAGELICTGPQTPREGGVIISRAATRDHVEKFVACDPFNIHSLADYRIVEFTPNKLAKGFEVLGQL